MEMDRAKLRPAPERLSRASAPERARTLDELMGAIQAGEKHAFAALVRKVSPLLRQVARNGGVAAADLDDVVQEALLALHRCQAHYDPERPFLPWLLGITRHCARDRWRRNLREDRRMLAIRALREAWGSAASDAGITGGLLVDSLTPLIAGLPPAQREAIEMVAIGDMDLRAASRATGRSVGAIKVNLHRARETLQQRLLACGDVTGPSRNRPHARRELAA